MKLSWIAAAASGVFLSLLLGSGSMAEELGPGVYFGYFNVDRWGQKVFHAGPHHLFVSEDVAAQLKTHVGKPLKLDVKDVYQPRNPGGGIIQKVSDVSTTKSSGLVLDAETDSHKVERGKGTPVRLAVRNGSSEEITLHPRSLAYVVVTRAPFPNAAIGYKDPDGRAYWYYQTSMRSQGQGRPMLRSACRQVLLSWTPQEYAENGEGVRVGDRTPTHHAPGVYYPLHMKPGGRFETTVIVGRELLPREYEVFFYQPSGNLSTEVGAISKRLPFDVVDVDSEDVE